jgi:hypothetical protein
MLSLDYIFVLSYFSIPKPSHIQIILPQLLLTCLTNLLKTDTHALAPPPPVLIMANMHTYALAILAQ